MIAKNSWVLIHRIIMTPEERAPQVPDDTRRVPLELWVKGRLREAAELGAVVTVVTRTGRIEAGTLLEVNPSYKHGFGDFVPELLEVSEQLHDILFGGCDAERVV
jgi:hypothetical protein